MFLIRSKRTNSSALGPQPSTIQSSGPTMPSDGKVRAGLLFCGRSRCQARERSMNRLATIDQMTMEEMLALPDDGFDRELIRGELREEPTTFKDRHRSRTETRIAHRRDPLIGACLRHLCIGVQGRRCRSPAPGSFPVNSVLSYSFSKGISKGTRPGRAISMGTSRLWRTLSTV